TRGPQSKDNTKNNRVSFASKSSCFKNKVEEHRRNLSFFANKKHTSCTKNVKLAKLNDRNECKKCLFDNVHDVCFSKYVNDMNYRVKAQRAKDSNTANHKKPKAKVKKTKTYPKEVQIATPSVSLPRNQKPRYLFRWRPTSRIFPLEKMLDTSVALVDSTE
ncbi:hypothetical protein Tco_1316917, partial [Tanacetum coccineum]